MDDFALLLGVILYRGCREPLFEVHRPDGWVDVLYGY